MVFEDAIHVFTNDCRIGPVNLIKIY